MLPRIYLSCCVRAVAKSLDKGENLLGSSKKPFSEPNLKTEIYLLPKLLLKLPGRLTLQ
jgi:hypothetical protein